MTVNGTLVTAEPGGSVSLAEHAYQLLKDRLIMLEIRPGEPINDGQLAADLGVGRTPVREALKRRRREFKRRDVPADTREERA